MMPATINVRQKPNHNSASRWLRCLHSSCIFPLLILLVAFSGIHARLDGARMGLASSIKLSSRYLEDTVDGSAKTGPNESMIDDGKDNTDGEDNTGSNKSTTEEGEVNTDVENKAGSNDSTTDGEKDESKDNGIIDNVVTRIDDVKDTGEAFVNTPISDWAQQEWIIATSAVLSVIGLMTCFCKCFCPFC